MSDAATARDLVLGYGSTVALDRSSFTIPRARVTVVIGPNGSGKSTLLNAMAGLLEPVSGILEVDAGNRHPPRIAYVLQTTKVNDSLPISVGEVVAMGRYSVAGSYRWLTKTDRDAVAEAMRRTGITDLARKQLNQLSGGQRQRVFVAQGLAQDHDLLLLDEPLTGIDLPTAQSIDQVIHDELTRGCTVVITTHDLSEARVSDHVLLLAGRVVTSGPPDEVLTIDHLTAAYGPALLHVEEEMVLLDDAAHTPVPGRHLHRDRTIHAEPAPTEAHPDSDEG